MKFEQFMIFYLFKNNQFNQIRIFCDILFVLKITNSIKFEQFSSNFICFENNQFNQIWIIFVNVFLKINNSIKFEQFLWIFICFENQFNQISTIFVKFYLFWK